MTSLTETLDAYIAASNSALRVFVDYKFGHATDRQVWAANKREREAFEAHRGALTALHQALVEAEAKIGASA